MAHDAPTGNAGLRKVASSHTSPAMRIPAIIKG